MIRAKGLHKQFKIFEKSPGIKGALKDLFKRDYQYVAAIQDFDIEISRGKIIGLLGPNGAGKTTLLKMFTGIIVPSGGVLKVNGYVPAKRDLQFRKKIALVMGQKSQLWWDLPAIDSFYMLQRYYEISDNDFRVRVRELSEILSVQSILRVHVRKLSLGERMKVELIASLLHDPEIIFLDEPTIGLDLISQQKIRKFIREYHQKTQSTIVLTSHYMADVKALCSQIVLLLEGEKRFDGTISEFEDLLGNDREVSFSFESPILSSDSFWHPLRPDWNESRTQVSVLLPESLMRKSCSHILQNYPVSDFKTENLPIERVLQAIMEKPHLLSSLK